MASSDDETDAVPQSVSNYYFEDENREPISFSVLPIHWHQNDAVVENKPHQIFLHGTADNGLQKIYKPVIAWRFEFLDSAPEVSVLAKENGWIKLQKPRKSYEELIRTILITLNFLNYVRRNPNALAKSIWDHLSRVFRSFEDRPSQNDLVDHMHLMSEAVKRDASLPNSKFLLGFLEKKPTKKILTEEDRTMSQFIVDDEEYIGDEDDSNDDDELFDSVCAFCDNGGELLCCEGICMRSFHATKNDGADSLCESLGLTAREVDAIENFTCKNCKYKKHQCFACGILGSSDKSSGAEVFQCANATCGYFYHPRCLAKLLHPEDKVVANELQQKIIAGESVTCPIHKCCICKQVENKKEIELQFAVCRRCPVSYHRKCLPREISFEDIEEQDIITRAWEELLPNRILIYCLKHEIDDEIGTPVRDHIIFPDIEEKIRKRAPELSASKGGLLLKKRKLATDGSSSEKTAMKSSNKLSSSMKKVEIVKKGEKASSGPDYFRRVGSGDASRKSSKEHAKSFSCEADRSPTARGNNTSLGDKLYALISKKSEQVKAASESEQVKTLTRQLSTELPALDPDSERRLLNLMKESASSITLEGVIKKHELSTTRMYSSKTIDKSITLGKVEGAIEAVKTALKKLDEGCSIEDAKVFCESDVLNQLSRWKSKLRVYLAPFLNGMRYSSFGRHFTKVDKLQEIVDMLHWYVQDDDMIVDFCCGANDFSCLMKKKLDEMGKKCSFRNYDIFHPKNDFNFKKKDWMTVQRKELPEGSRLIMGLNPPFGVRAALANKFINKALEFEPKLLILIVPPETERLNRKNPPYDLVWEQDQFLSGKSFYLPGSVDVNDKQMEQWNVTPPPLYLWSRHDWSSKHKAIAEKHGHVSRQKKELNLGSSGCETETPHTSIEYHYTNADASVLTGDLLLENNVSEEAEHEMVMPEGLKDGFPCNDGDGESHDSYGPGNSRSNESSRKRRHDDEMCGRGMRENLLDDSHSDGRPFIGNTHKGVARNSPSSMVGGRYSLDHPRSGSHDLPAHAEAGEPGFSGLHTRHGTAYGGNWASSQGDMDRRYNVNSDESCYSGVRFSGATNLDSNYASYMRGGPEHTGRSHPMEFERLSGTQSQSHFFGPDPTQREYAGSHDLGYGPMGSMPSVPYGHLSSSMEPSHRIGMSTMDRYAPRLDELNHTRMNHSSSEPPMLHRNEIYDPSMPPPGYRVDPMGFAPGPHYPYPHYNSAGWLND